MYKIIFCDIDGTLLDSFQQISARTKEKIRELDKQGITFVLTSSRPSMGVFSVLDELAISAPVIAYSGALIYNDNREAIKNYEIETRAAQEIHDFIVNENDRICCSMYSDDLWLVDDKCNPWIMNEEKIVGIEAVEGKIGDYPKCTGVNKLLCMGNADDISEIFVKLKCRYPTLGMYRSKSTYLEINNAAATKANAMRFLCDNMDISISNTVAFGDSDVDMEMIQMAGLGFVMRNASEKMKHNAPNIAASNDDEGIFWTLATLEF